jgi:hypothetical protein
VTPVRAGTISAWKYAAYLLAVMVEIAAATVIMAVCAGTNRVFTGLLLGLVLAGPLGWLLRRTDSVELSDRGLALRSMWRTRCLGWDRVLGGRFAYDEHGRWTLALDLTAGDERNQELVLLSIPPITRPVSNAYEMRKCEQVNEIRAMLRRRRIPITVVPDILTALQTYWKIAPPTKSPTDSAEPEG